MMLLPVIAYLLAINSTEYYQMTILKNIQYLNLEGVKGKLEIEEHYYEMMVEGVKTKQSKDQ